MFAFLYLVDNVALTLREAQGAYTLNLYRGREVGPFDDDDLVSLNVLVPLLASLIRRHYRQACPLSQRPEGAVSLLPPSESRRQGLLAASLSGLRTNVIFRGAQRSEASYRSVRLQG
ncbi:hypothetical protein ACQKFL_20410 [Vreelandella titanicae]|uniref:hypothetical protein n=1 Tax=Vreelandella titanicae TaxID=664683 RepID=UPI001F1AE105|nr:hypothetical protein [Halomonas titanicae]MCE7520633.1 hypothetical protein [Halomonas titanicae]